MAENTKSSKFGPTPVDDYPERPLKEALDKDAEEVRPQVDQIEDYHKTHPTLKASDLPSNEELAKINEKSADVAEKAAQDALPGT